MSSAAAGRPTSTDVGKGDVRRGVGCGVARVPPLFEEDDDPLPLPDRDSLYMDLSMLDMLFLSIFDFLLMEDIMPLDDDEEDDDIDRKYDLEECNFDMPLLDFLGFMGTIIRSGVGFCVRGTPVGRNVVGRADSTSSIGVGNGEGAGVGSSSGSMGISLVGSIVGGSVGERIGESVGEISGELVGESVGTPVSMTISCTGEAVGASVAGKAVGSSVVGDDVGAGVSAGPTAGIDTVYTLPKLPVVPAKSCVF